jgi:AraC-like DNA-binding protein
VRAYETQASPPSFCVSTRSAELTFVLEGELELGLGASKRTVIARAGEGVIVLRGTPHSSRTTRGTRLVIVDVANAPFAGLGAVPLPERALPLALERLVPLLWDQRALVAEDDLGRATSTLFSAGSADTVVPIDTAHTTARMLSVKNHLEAHYSEPVRLEEIARVFGMDRFYLVRNYRRNFGLSPIAYVHALRMEHFAWSLLYDARSLAALANDAGFGDYATFCRRIHKRFGRAPSELVQSNGGRDPCSTSNSA